MVRGAFSTFALLSAVAAVNAQQGGADILGWDRALWGMTTEAVSHAYPDAFVDDSRCLTDADLENFDCRQLRLPNVVSNSLHWNATFRFHHSDKGLSEIELKSSDSRVVNAGTFEQLALALERSYGTAMSVADRFNSETFLDQCYALRAQWEQGDEPASEAWFRRSAGEIRTLAFPSSEVIAEWRIDSQCPITPVEVEPDLSGVVMRPRLALTLTYKRRQVNGEVGL